jgi:hypothetical protein
VRVSAVNDDVTLLEVRLELLDEIVNGIASFHEKDDFAGSFKLRAELFDGVRANDVGA